VPNEPGTRPGRRLEPLTAVASVQWARMVERVISPIPVPACLPLAPGVYRFRDRAGRVLYIGRAVNLRRRVLSYWGDLGDRGHLAPMVARIARAEAVVCDTAHEAAWLERNLLQRRLPPWNRSPGGQEAEVWIRLSVQPRHPGLTVVRRPAPGDFGPYLGGQKARDAVSGIARVLPLAHAADGRAGAERDLAQLRGGSPGARAELARAIAAVLGRDRDAVAALRAELTARRVAAAAALAFEFAGKLQAELEALDWITGEQKVTRAPWGQDDVDVYGWADGVLVCFEIRGGRVSGWRQRLCAAAVARPYLDQSPPGWASFARRNAELAARLRSPRAEPAARFRACPPGTCAG
jgi:excinuclease ABC subunit C